MNRFVSFGSPEYMRMQRDRRIHVLPSTPRAVAVHLVFAGYSHVVYQGSLSKSKAEARKLAHSLMQQWDVDNPMPVFQLHATLQPIFAQQMHAANNYGKAFDAQQLNADYELIVQTCYEAICHCTDPQVRMQAAHILHAIGYIPRDAQ